MTTNHNPSRFHGASVQAWSVLSTGTRQLRRQVAKSLRSVVAALVSPALIIVALTLVGTGLGVAGVFTMWGRGPALLAGCGFAFMLAALIARGGNV